MENRPVGRQVEGDVAELEDLVEREGKCEEGGPKKGQREAEGGHGEKKDVSKDEEDVMERDNALPSETGEEGDTAEFFIEGKGLKVSDNEIGKCKEGYWDGNGKEAMHVPCLKDKRNGGNHVTDMHREEYLAKTTIGESEWRNGVCKDDRK